MARRAQLRGGPPSTATSDAGAPALAVALALHAGLLAAAWALADDNQLFERMRLEAKDEPQLLWVDLEEAATEARLPGEDPAAAGEEGRATDSSPPTAEAQPRAASEIAPPPPISATPPEVAEPPTPAEPPAAPAETALAAIDPSASSALDPSALDPSALDPSSLDPSAPPSEGPPAEGPATPWPPAEDGYGEAYAALPGLPGGDMGWSALALAQPDVSGLPAKTSAPDAKQVDPAIAGKVLSSTLRSRDRELGLEMPAAGVVSSAVSAAVRSVPVPDDTRATFEVRLSPSGRVEHARVVSSTKGDAALWERAAKSTAASLAARPLTMSGEAEQKGATVVVEVEAQRVYPANSKKQVDVKPVCADRVIRDAIQALDDGRGNADPLAPKAAPTEESDFCIPIGVSGVGDASNLGAHLQTVVRTKHKVVIDGVVDLPTEVHAVNTDAPWVKRNEKGPRPLVPSKWRKKKQDWEKKNQGRSRGPASIKQLDAHD